MKKILLNPAVSYRQKNGVYVFYYNFNYIFFSGVAAKLIDLLMSAIKNGTGFEVLPDSFISFLSTKKIILEE